MAVRYLFNTSGEYVAFQSGDNLFSPDAHWIGFVRQGNLVYSVDGSFLGYILDDDRVARHRNEPPRPKLPKPMTPLKPLKPLRPMKRLRMPKLPPHLEDVFEYGVEGVAPSRVRSAKNLKDLEGSKLFAADDTYLGKVTKNRFDSESLLNQFGSYGNQFNANSVFNQFGRYGKNKFSGLSPYNEFSRTPPRFMKGPEVLAYLTKNQFVTPRVDPDEFFRWLGRTP